MGISICFCFCFCSPPRSGCRSAAVFFPSTSFHRFLHQLLQPPLERDDRVRLPGARLRPLQVHPGVLARVLDNLHLLEGVFHQPAQPPLHPLDQLFGAERARLEVHQVFWLWQPGVRRHPGFRERGWADELFAVAVVRGIQNRWQVLLLLRRSRLLARHRAGGRNLGLGSLRPLCVWLDRGLPLRQDRGDRIRDLGCLRPA
mmetsp:Transcript_22391/g.56584  ORF Transcript_22391/g.56584 Transcript_22391/m.56584 type:complete len:201 (-) Transcript_22391:170-772(-)